MWAIYAFEENGYNPKIYLAGVALTRKDRDKTETLLRKSHDHVWSVKVHWFKYGG